MGRNMLVDGEWRTDVESPTDEDGEYRRVESGFRDWIRAAPDARFTPDDRRYHLYVSRSCPWAHGVALVRRLKDLADAITVDLLDPVRHDEGWEFTPEKNGCTPDTVNGADYLREVYVKADPDYTGRVTTPVLWDREHETIVNNESIEIMRMLDRAFDEYSPAAVDLYPEGYRNEVDDAIEEMYDPLNNGVYRAGFADSQEAYEAAVEDVFEALDHYDELLADRRYLAGDRLTLADVRLFPTLIRFDEVYHTHFRCNRRRIEEYDHLWGYLRDLYQTPGFAETVNVDHIKQGYVSGSTLNPKGIVPVGPDPDFEAAHDRDRLAGEAPTLSGPAQ